MIAEFALAVIFAGGGASPFLPRQGETEQQFCVRASENWSNGKIVLFEDGKTEGIGITKGEDFSVYVIYPTKDHKPPHPCNDFDYKGM